MRRKCDRKEKKGADGRIFYDDYSRKYAKTGSNAFRFPITGLHLCANQDGWRQRKRKGRISPFLASGNIRKTAGNG